MTNQTEIEYHEARIDDASANIPSHMIGGVKRYVLHGIAGGSFLTALFSNDLMGAIGKADYSNQAALIEWARFIHNHVPSGCHGSPEKVSAWIASGGLAHREQVAA